MALLLLVLVCLHLSFEQSQAEDEIRVLAEEVGILRLKVEELETGRKLDQPAPPSEARSDARPPETTL
jgi:hypothetical protein